MRSEDSKTSSASDSAYAPQQMASTAASTPGQHMRETNVNVSSISRHGQNYARAYQYPSPTANRSPPMQIPRLQTSSSNSPSASDDRNAKPRFGCPVPGCPVSCSRVASVTRHINTKHDITNQVWVCDICGHWQNQAREDRMWHHCKINHGQMPNAYRYHLIDNVGQQTYEPKVSQEGKPTRRRKKRVY